MNTAYDLLAEISYAPDHAIVGPQDNRIQEIRTTQFPFNTICHMERDFGDGIWRGCSATLLSPTLVLTAGHCLYNHNLRMAPLRIRITPGRADRYTMPYGTIMARECYVPRGYVSRTGASRTAWTNFDYGIVALPRGVRGITRFMEMRCLADSELNRLSQSHLVNVAGYPGDRPLGTLWRHRERLVSISPVRIYYTVDTCPGHSGSPIWYREGARRYIIGVHTSGPIDEMGLAYGCSRAAVSAPPGMRNSGIRITPEVSAAIRDPYLRIDGMRGMIWFPLH